MNSLLRLVDTHCHIHDGEFYDAEARDEAYRESIKNGVAMICVGTDLRSSRQALEFARMHDFVWPVVGIHPHDAATNNVEELRQLVADNRDETVGIGEIGLDYHYDVDRDMQKDAFIRQIELANKYDLPIVIHTREATVDTINILKENPVNKVGMFHCCPLNQELVKEALKLGFYISVCGPITFKNSKNAEVVVNMIPLDRILVETDSPYLSPEPLRGRRNDSRNIKYIVEKIALFKMIEPEVLMDSVFGNINRLFKNIKNI